MSHANTEAEIKDTRLIGPQKVTVRLQESMLTVIVLTLNVSKEDSLYMYIQHGVDQILPSVTG